MKKLFALLLVAVMCFSLVACGGGNDTTTANNNNEQQTNESGSQQETVKIDISKLEGTWRGTEEGANWEMYFVFDGNGNMTRYTKNIETDYTSLDGTYKYEYNAETKKSFYWSTEEAGAFCPVEITEENGNVQYKILYMICEQVENFTPNITE